MKPSEAQHVEEIDQARRWFWWTVKQSRSSVSPWQHMAYVCTTIYHTYITQMSNRICADAASSRTAPAARAPVTASSLCCRQVCRVAVEPWGHQCVCVCMYTKRRNGMQESGFIQNPSQAWLAHLGRLVNLASSSPTLIETKIVQARQFLIDLQLQLMTCLFEDWWFQAQY